MEWSVGVEFLLLHPAGHNDRHSARQRNAILKWRFRGWPMVARFYKFIEQFKNIDVFAFAL